MILNFAFYKSEVIKCLTGKKNIWKQQDSYRYSFIVGIKFYPLFYYLYIYEVYQGMRFHRFNDTYMLFNVGASIEPLISYVYFIGLDTFVFSSAPLTLFTTLSCTYSYCVSLH